MPPWNRSLNGRLLHLSLLTKRGTYRLCSATDPDATIRNHGGDKQDFAYNVTVLATVQFIYEIQVDTGSRPDGDALADVLQAQLEQRGLCPDKLIYDQAAGWGKIAHQVATGFFRARPGRAVPLPSTFATRSQKT